MSVIYKGQSPGLPREEGGRGTETADDLGATLALSSMEWPALGSASRRRRLFVLFFLNYFL